MSVGTIGQDTKRIARHRNKHVEYACGCRYLFDHHIVLECICTGHENELIAHHGRHSIVLRIDLIILGMLLKIHHIN
jgi:hypothetical protein